MSGRNNLHGPHFHILTVVCCFMISQVTHADFKKAKEKVMFKKKEGVPEGLYM
jgi:hypothetical protein